MKKIVEIYFEKWYLPVIIAVILSVIGLFTIVNPNQIIFYLSLGIPLFAFLISGILGILRIFKKDLKFGVLQIFLTGLLALIVIYFTSFILAFYPYDFYADNLEIPKNIEIYKPIDELSKKINKKHIKEKFEFNLYNSSQPGIYSYDITVERIEKGYIYLKAFEVTTNDRLSEVRINMRSKIIVDNISNKLKTYKLEDDFTIYEGDWGKPYAVRFEIWLNNGTVEKKITEKNYIIEGWQR